MDVLFDTGNLFYARALALGRQSPRHSHWLMTDGISLAQALLRDRGSHSAAPSSDMSDMVKILEQGVRQVLGSANQSSLNAMVHVFDGAGGADLACMIPSQVLNTFLNSTTNSTVTSPGAASLREYIQSHLKPIGTHAVISSDDIGDVSRLRRKKFGWFRVLPSS